MGYLQMLHFKYRLLLAISLGLLGLIPALAAPPDFDRDVAPLLLQRCGGCHSGSDLKADFDITRKAQVLTDLPTKLPIWLRIRDGEMPPKKPLADREKKVISDWVESGAPWGTDPIDPWSVSTSERAGRDWWSLKPVRRPEVPAVSSSSPSPPVNPIDAFVLAELKQKRLNLSPPAEPRALIRRLAFDLTGLPPTPEQIEDFCRAPSDAAYQKLVDQLLNSPSYGEKWARHWLDVVRFGESDGFERNNPRLEAWHYRDWVIRALNEDMPFDEFARLQIAGDILRPDDPAAIKATGFLVAGIHNTVLGSNAVANETARQDELEEIIATTCQAFLGLTVQCARCHDHKFDPISQKDYYQVAGSLAGVFHGDRSVHTSENPAERAKQEATLRSKVADADRSLASLKDKALRNVEPKARGQVNNLAGLKPVARWTFDGHASDDVGQQALKLEGGARIENRRLILDGKSAFAVSPPLAANLREKTLEAWVSLSRLDQGGGGVISVESESGEVFDAIVFGERHPRRWMNGSNAFQRTVDLDGPEETSTPGELVHVAITYNLNGKIRVYRNGAKYGQDFDPPGKLPTFQAGSARFLFGKRHTGGGRPFFAGEIDEVRVYDRALSAEEIARSAQFGPGPLSLSREQILQNLSNDERLEFERLSEEKAQAAKTLAKITEKQKVFAVTPRPAGKTFLLARGSVEKKAGIVSPGFVDVLARGKTPGAEGEPSESQRRQLFAENVVSDLNPLFTRVIVNRLWNHHFGIGIVETPSDFGFNGGRPSHPLLLDWLAAELRDHGYSLKHIHRLIVTSATYRQSSQPDAAAKSIDAENRLLWRKSPSRLEAETLRDTMLLVAGQLNRAASGPGFQDVKVYFNAGTTYYEPIASDGPAVQRRTIYRFSPRGERSAVLDTFDCPDPSAATPRRQVTTTPLQALALWNNQFVVQMAERLAERVRAESEDGQSRRIERAFKLVLGRDPSPAEAKRSGEIVSSFGLEALARVLFNCNELVVIE